VRILPLSSSIAFSLCLYIIPSLSLSSSLSFFLISFYLLYMLPGGRRLEYDIWLVVLSFAGWRFSVSSFHLLLGGFSLFPPSILSPLPSFLQDINRITMKSYVFLKSLEDEHFQLVERCIDSCSSSLLQ